MTNMSMSLAFTACARHHRLYPDWHLRFHYPGRQRRRLCGRRVTMKENQLLVQLESIGITGLVRRRRRLLIGFQSGGDDRRPAGSRKSRSAGLAGWTSTATAKTLQRRLIYCAIPWRRALPHGGFFWPAWNRFISLLKPGIKAWSTSTSINWLRWKWAFILSTGRCSRNGFAGRKWLRQYRWQYRRAIANRWAEGRVDRP